jgi:hypothetical protein
MRYDYPQSSSRRCARLSLRTLEGSELVALWALREHCRSGNQPSSMLATTCSRWFGLAQVEVALADIGLVARYRVHQFSAPAVPSDGPEVEVWEQLLLTTLAALQRRQEVRAGALIAALVPFDTGGETRRAVMRFASHLRRRSLLIPCRAVLQVVPDLPTRKLRSRL